jgi:amidase
MSIHYLSAHEALQRFRSKSLSPVELMQAIIDRAEIMEPKINAFTHTFWDRAMRQASEAEARYQRGDARPLEGIPTAIKISHAIEGQPVSASSMAFDDPIAPQTAPNVQRLLDAGAIIHARTTSPEFAISGNTWSYRWGVTRNPWNLEMTPGGSSGGSGAALAAGTTTIANGGDILGSIRIPSSLSGLVGFKAPYGRNPDLPPYNSEPYYSPGVLARNVRDLILQQNIISGPHPIDMNSLPDPIELPLIYPNISGMKLAYSIDFDFQEVDADVRRNTLALIDRLVDLGAHAERVPLGWHDGMVRAANDHLGYSPTSLELVQLAKSEQLEKLTPYGAEAARRSAAATQRRAYQAESLASDMHSQMNTIFESHDLFICPTVANAGIPADFCYGTDDLEINGSPVDPAFGWLMTYPFNMLNRLPVVAVPSGRAANNVPTGVQLVGPPHQDAVPFRVAAALEQAMGTFYDGEQAQLPDYE